MGHRKRPAPRANARALSRENAAGHYEQRRRRRQRSRRVKVALVIILALVVCVGGAALAYVGYIQGKLNLGISQETRDALSTEKIGEPFYMLLLGTDKSKERAASADFGEDNSNYRTDSIMLARIDPNNKKVTLVSIERDTLVNMGEHGKQKINAAYSFGGAPYTIEVISKFAGVPISHYAEINFDDFVGVVDKIGGIDVDIKIDLDDDLAGLHLKKGEQTIDGAQALALCRARHAYDAYGGGDYYRTANQRMVLGAILKKVLQGNPATIASTVDSLAGSVTTDFSIPQILGLANDFRGFDTSKDLMTGLEPTSGVFVNGGWYEQVNEEAWKEMMDRVNQGLSPYSSADQDFTSSVAGTAAVITGGDEGEGASEDEKAAYSGKVTVLNGTTVSGLAAKVADKLSAAGFTTATDTAKNPYDTTVVAYLSPGAKAAAEGVAKTLGSDITVEDGQGQYSGFDGQDVLVILGADLSNFGS